MTQIKLADLQGKKIAVLGFGIEGQSAARFLLKHQVTVTVIDEKPEAEFYARDIEEFRKQNVEFVFGQIPDLIDYDIIVRSPGIYLMRDEIQKAHKAGVIVSSPIKLFFDFCPTQNIVGVTGTKGKGTTSSLIYEMLKKQGFDAHLGGNIGNSPLDFLDELSSNSWVVLELSSFQLQDLHTSPHIAVMLMVTSEHLDVHKDVMEYVEAKQNILNHQTADDFAVLNWDYPATRESDIHTVAPLFQVSREQGIEQGAYVEGSEIRLKMDGKDELLIKASDLKLPGKHNFENVMAASVVASLAGVEKANIVKVLKTFEGLPHRLELVRTVKGVRYYNDSFSTTPETAIAAIESFDAPKILILGGSSKGSDFAELGALISSDQSIKGIVELGEEWKKIKERITDYESRITVVEGLNSMQEVVRAAADIAELGDVVLMSPACASFDKFKNYKDRGEQFKAAVESLVH